jgi:hypothetical protein
MASVTLTQTVGSEVRPGIGLQGPRRSGVKVEVRHAAPRALPDLRTFCVGWSEIRPAPAAVLGRPPATPDDYGRGTREHRPPPTSVLSEPRRVGPPTVGTTQSLAVLHSPRDTSAARRPTRCPQQGASRPLETIEYRCQRANCSGSSSSAGPCPKYGHRLARSVSSQRHPWQRAAAPAATPPARRSTNRLPRYLRGRPERSLSNSMIFGPMTIGAAVVAAQGSPLALAVAHCADARSRARHAITTTPRS